MSLERELTFVEQYYYYETQYYQHPQYSVYGEYSSEISLPLLYKALKLMIETYPQLSLQVFKNGDRKKDLKMSYLDHYDFKSVVQILDSSQSELPINELLQHLSTETFEYFLSDKPLWGLKLIKPNKIIFHCEHILFDGMSGFHFHRILRDSLNTVLFQDEKLGNAAEGLTDDQVYDKELFSINSKLVDKAPAQTTDIVNYGFSLRFFFQTVYSMFLPKLLKKTLMNIGLMFKKRVPFDHNLKFDTYESGRTIKATTEYKSTVGPSILLRISNDDLNKLINKCRSENVKITALLSAVFQLCALPFTGEKDVSNLVPVDIRKYTKPESPYKAGSPQLDLGLYVSGMEFDNPSAARLYPGSFSALYNYKLGSSSTLSDFKFNWNFARDFQKKFEETIDDSPYLFGMLRGLDVEDVVKDNMSLDHVVAFVLSNLKQMKQSKDKYGELNDFQLVDMVFSQPSTPVSGCYTFNAISTDVNGMNIAVTTYAGFDDELKHFEEIFPAIIDGILKDL